MTIGASHNVRPRVRGGTEAPHTYATRRRRAERAGARRSRVASAEVGPPRIVPGKARAPLSTIAQRPPGHQPRLRHEESTVASGTLQIDCQMGERRGRWHVATKGRAWRGRDARREEASAQPKGPSPKNHVIATATARSSRPISLSASIASVVVRDCCAYTEVQTLTTLTMPTSSPS